MSNGRDDLVFRVFVSSTFSDLVAEREQLETGAFPALREYAQSLGAYFEAVDLRWGVSEEAFFDQQAMPICLSEIARCQDVSPRPNFIVLLGQRYGARPLPAYVDAVELDGILQVLSSKEKKRLIRWYRRDENAVPAAYCLLPRGGPFRDEETWRKEENRLRTSLLGGDELRDGHDTPEWCKHWQSATHQEVECGALQPHLEARDHVFAYFRTITCPPKGKDAAGFVDDGADRASLDALKESLRGRLSGEHIYEYEAPWETDHPGTDLRALSDRVQRDLETIIAQEVEVFRAKSPLEREGDAHDRFCDERRKSFLGRVDSLNRIQEYLGSRDRSPLFIHGVAGVGKSALLAASCHEHRSIASNGGTVVVLRFVGASAGAAQLGSLLTGVCEELALRYDGEGTVPKDIRQVAEVFARRLSWATVDRPLLIYFDALDQLPLDDAEDLLSRLPRTLPPHTKIVASFTDDTTVCSRAKELFAPSSFLKLGTLSSEHGETLLTTWLALARRTLQPEQIDEVLEKFAGCPTPLYLKLAFEQSRQWKSYDRLPQRPGGERGIGTTVEDVIAELFDDLARPRRHGRFLTERALCYLASSRYGLTDHELIALLSADAGVMSEFTNSSPTELAKPWGERLRRLPPFMWSRLRYELESYLSERLVNDLTVVTFSHDRVRATVETLYLRNDVARVCHQAIARYFEKLASNARRTRELPWQLARAGSWQTLFDLLSDLDFLADAWELDSIDVRRYWAQIQRNCELRAVDAYDAVLERPDQYEAKEVWLVADLLHDLGDAREALPLREHLSAVAGESESDEALARARGTEGLARYELGQLDEALRLFEEDERLSRRAGDMEGVQAALGHQAIVLRKWGKFDRAFELLDEQAALCTEIGNDRCLATCLGNRALILLDSRKVDEAGELFDQQEKMLRDLKDIEKLAECLGNQAIVCSARADYDEALRLLGEQRRIWVDIGNVGGHARAHLNEAGIVFDLGEYGRARSMAQEAYDLVESKGLDELVVSFKRQIKRLLPAAAIESLETGQSHAGQDFASRLQAQIESEFHAPASAMEGVAKRQAATAARLAKERGECVESQRDGVPEIDWVEIPAGPFLMGGIDEEDTRSYPNPQRRVSVASFCISRFPITTAQFDSFLAAGGHETLASEESPHHPRVDVNWEEAYAFCEWLGEKLGRVIRLPSEEEWEKSARGLDGRLFPEGNDYSPGRHAFGGVVPVWQNPLGASPFGVLDMIGNVWQWTDSKREDSESYVTRGGASRNPTWSKRCAFRRSQPPDSRESTLGFRIATSVCD